MEEAVGTSLTPYSLTDRRNEKKGARAPQPTGTRLFGVSGTDEIPDAPGDSIEAQAK